MKISVIGFPGNRMSKFETLSLAQNAQREAGAISSSALPIPDENENGGFGRLSFEGFNELEVTTPNGTEIRTYVSVKFREEYKQFLWAPQGVGFSLEVMGTLSSDKKFALQVFRKDYPGIELVGFGVEADRETVRFEFSNVGGAGEEYLLDTCRQISDELFKQAYLRDYLHHFANGKEKIYCSYIEGEKAIFSDEPLDDENQMTCEYLFQLPFFQARRDIAIIDVNQENSRATVYYHGECHRIKRAIQDVKTLEVVQMNCIPSKDVDEKSRPMDWYLYWGINQPQYSVSLGDGQILDTTRHEMSIVSWIQLPRNNRNAKVFAECVHKHILDAGGIGAFPKLNEMPEVLRRYAMTAHSSENEMAFSSDDRVLTDSEIKEAEAYVERFPFLKGYIEFGEDGEQIIVYGGISEAINFI